MSAFLGHIHYWLFNKIKLVQQREQLLFAQASALCGDTAEELREQAWQTYSPPLPEKDLADLIDHSNIHGWLQRQINIAETREAAMIKDLLDVCGETAKDLIATVFHDHGRSLGEQAKAQGNYDTISAGGIYKALNDYLLNGMPCDQNDQMIEQTTTKLIWESGSCAQQPNWSRVGVNPQTMREFYVQWLKGFVGGINAEFAYRHTPGTSTGVLRQEIYRQ